MGSYIVEDGANSKHYFNKSFILKMRKLKSPEASGPDPHMMADSAGVLLPLHTPSSIPQPPDYFLVFPSSLVQLTDFTSIQ